nr:MAG TPA: hypothetical protein [Bacteriophage sp.]DAT29113.1 MAG TPA: hypothetical protein [Caudoviricetes sp.]
MLGFATLTAVGFSTKEISFETSPFLSLKVL